MEILFALIANIPVLVLLGYIWTEHNKRVEKVEKRVDEVEINYLDRFDTVNGNLTDIKVDVANLVERSKK